MFELLRKLLDFPRILLGSPGVAPARRSDLDWLRIAAFGLLIFYHIGMLYVARWGYHFKSQYTSASLESVMLLVNPWRMPVLWLVSGIAIRFVLAKVTVWRFIGFRTFRLLLPLLFAILVIIPPQLYFEMKFNGDMSVGYIEFYRAFFDLNHPMFKDYQAGIWPHINVNQLWYLRELWLFSLYLLCLLPILNSHWMKAVFDWLSTRRGALVFLLAAIPILTIELAIEDNRKQIGFAFLVYGYMLGWHRGMWVHLNENCRPMLTLALISYLALLVTYNLFWVNQTDPKDTWLLISAGVLYGLCRLFWLFAILGLATRFLDRPSKYLAYFNEAVYPYYIVHQTIIIVAAAQLSAFSLGPVIEPLLVIACTISGCVISFELIRRMPLVRPLFGLKTGLKISKSIQQLGYVLATVVLVPFALEILF